MYRETSSRIAPFSRHGEVFDGVQYSLETARRLPPQTRASLGIILEDDIAPADPIPDHKVADGAAEPKRINGVLKWVQPVKNAPVLTLAERRDTAQQQLGARWDTEEKGGTSALGWTVRTDAEGQAKITGGIVAFSNDPTLGTVPYELTPGVWLDLDEPTMCALGVVVAQHVKACAARARVISEALTAANTHAAMDEAIAAIETGWPGQE